MEANKILKADILDIIFDGRYKDYGAYELRKSYHQRIKLALTYTVIIATIFFTVTSLFKTKAKKGSYIIDDVFIDSFEPEINKPKVLPTPPKSIVPKQAITSYTIPIIVNDDKVKENETPPIVENLADTKIGTINQEGDKFTGIVEDPKEFSTGVAPIKVEEEYDKFYPTVQIESEFPGGQDAWRTFLQRNLNSEVPKNNGAPAGKYTVEVSFIVDREGNISNVMGSLANDGSVDYGTIEEAIRVIKRGPKWKPGVQNGIQVKSRKKQKITFLITED